MTTQQTVKIQLVRSPIGTKESHRATVRGLGLRKLNSSVIQDDSPSIRGMIFKVRHLVSFEEVASDTTKAAPARTHSTIVRPAAEEAPKAAKPAPSTARNRQTVVLSNAELSEALAPDQESADAPASPPASRQTMVLSEADAPATPAPAAKPDDLEVIEGIGPKIAGLLRDAGITSFAELAATSVARLEEILSDAKLNLASPETWPEQAELAAAGDWDALTSLQDQLKGGRKE